MIRVVAACIRGSDLGDRPADFTGAMIGGLIIHLINGTFIISSIGILTGLGVSRSEVPSRKAYKCKTCGASFNSQDELTSHGKTHMKSAKQMSKQQFKFDACGATFGSQSELMEHAKKARPMPSR